MSRRELRDFAWSLLVVGTPTLTLIAAFHVELFWRAYL